MKNTLKKHWKTKMGLKLMPKDLQLTNQFKKSKIILINMMKIIQNTKQLKPNT